MRENIPVQNIPNKFSHREKIRKYQVIILSFLIEKNNCYFTYMPEIEKNSVLFFYLYFISSVSCQKEHHKWR